MRTHSRTLEIGLVAAGNLKKRLRPKSGDEPLEIMNPSPAAPEAPISTGADHAADQETDVTSSVWKMSLVVTASALCGGIAVVLWNRRLLTKLREVVPVAREDRQGSLWEDDDR